MLFKASNSKKKKTFLFDIKVDCLSFIITIHAASFITAGDDVCRCTCTTNSSIILRVVIIRIYWYIYKLRWNEYLRSLPVISIVERCTSFFMTAINCTKWITTMWTDSQSIGVEPMCIGNFRSHFFHQSIFIRIVCLECYKEVYEIKVS